MNVNFIIITILSKNKGQRSSAALDFCGRLFDFGSVLTQLISHSHNH